MTEATTTDKTNVVTAALKKAAAKLKPITPYAIGAASVLGLQAAWKFVVKPLVNSISPTFEEVVETALDVANEN